MGSPWAGADTYFSELVRARGACERCGRTDNLQCAHIIRRRHVGDPDLGFSLRCCEDNAWCLCAECHRIVDNDAVAFTELVDRTIGRAKYEELLVLKHRPHRRWTPKDRAAERARLRGLLKECRA